MLTDYLSRLKTYNNPRTAKNDEGHVKTVHVGLLNVSQPKTKRDRLKQTSL